MRTRRVWFPPGSDVKTVGVVFPVYSPSRSMSAFGGSESTERANCILVISTVGTGAGVAGTGSGVNTGSGMGSAAGGGLAGITLNNTKNALTASSSRPGSPVIRSGAAVICPKANMSGFVVLFSSAGVTETTGVAVFTGVTVAVAVGSTFFPEIANREKPGDVAS